MLPRLSFFVTGAIQPFGIMRFRPEQHVRRQRDFRNLRENGRRFECGGFTFWYYRRVPVADVSAPSDSASASKSAASLVIPENIARVGVVASYAAVGKAVSRVRAKRRLREVFRRNQQLVPGGFDVMLVARRAINGMEFSAIEKKFTEACGRVFQK